MSQFEKMANLSFSDCGFNSSERAVLNALPLTGGYDGR